MSVIKLYFAQHGRAVDKADDPERPLSQKGIEQSTDVAKQLQALGATISTICHSNKLRAQQTAEIFASNLNLADVSEAEHLSPNDDISLIKQNLTLDNTLYIGHLPHLGKLVSSLVTGNDDLDIIKFQNSAVICLEKNDGRYKIFFYLTPHATGG
jgi:phosphohistidine phosphatase